MITLQCSACGDRFILNYTTRRDRAFVAQMLNVRGTCDIEKRPMVFWIVEK